LGLKVPVAIAWYLQDYFSKAFLKGFVAAAIAAVALGSIATLGILQMGL